MAPTKKIFHVDSRLPVGQNVDPNDPSHPVNITRNNIAVQDQAAADSKYDIQPAQRVEGFMNMPLPTDKQLIWAVFFSSLITAFVSISFLTYTQSLYTRIFFIIAAVISINYGIASLEKVTV